jgi:Mn2+/Fe2+ NRAMP family transporter
MNMLRLKTPPVGLSIVLILGPSLVWCSEYIGSGEVILATRTGAILGSGILWAVISGIFLKFWIGMSGARYTVATGEGMVDMIARMPGPRNWGVWIILIAQFFTAALSIGSLANAAGVFLSNMIPVSSSLCGWAVAVFGMLVAWSGEFKILKVIMSALIFVVIFGIIYVSVCVFPGWQEVFSGLIPRVPGVPLWAIDKGINPNPWKEILPLIGWGAGGFASQVWYTYWIMGAGYGMTVKNQYGKPADTDLLKKIDVDDAYKIKGWFRVVYADASMATVIGVVVTCGFVICGAGVLGPLHLAPEGSKLAIDLSNIFASRWGKLGGFLFMLGGTSALVSTQIGQLAGWPRLLADSFRICIPRFNRIEWKKQYRIFLLFFFLTNMIIVFTLGLKPVALIKTSAILDGLLLTPLQALWVFAGLTIVQPKLFTKEVSAILKPHWIFGLMLLLAFVVFFYYCIWKIPEFL